MLKKLFDMPAINKPDNTNFTLIVECVVEKKL